jgi:hypothetical protein
MFGYLTQTSCEIMASTCPSTLFASVNSMYQHTSCSLANQLCNLLDTESSVVCTPINEALHTATEACLEAVKECAPTLIHQYAPVALGVTAVALLSVGACIGSRCCRL